MATGGVLGNGVRVGYSAASPVSWTRVTQILEVTFPQMVADDVDTTVHSTSRVKRNMPGMIEVSEMTLLLEADLDPATSASHDALWTLQKAGTTVWWRAEVPTDRTQSACVPFEFQGYVKSWAPSTPIDDKQTIEVVVRFDGDDLYKLAKGSFTIS
jgi:hypothetical protein